MDAHRAAADLPAVQHHVVGLGVGFLRRAVDVALVAVLRTGERMVAGLPGLRFRLELEHREIDHPERSPALLGQTAIVPDLVPQRAHIGIHYALLAGAEEDDVAILGCSSLQNETQCLGVEVLYDRRLQALGAARALVDLDPGEALGTERLGVLAIGVELAARERAAAGDRS